MCVILTPGQVIALGSVMQSRPHKKGGKMSEKRIPWFRFYPADFMDGVRGLSAQEVGLYTMLLCRMYEESGAIEDHTLRLSTYCGMREKTFTATLDKLVALGKIRRRDGMLTNDRAEAEIADRSDDLKIASAAGKASAKKRQQKQGKASTGVQRAFNHTDTDTDIKERDANASLKKVDAEPDPFEDFWQAYPHRGGAKKGKAAARKAWTRATTAKVDRTEPAEIIAAARAYHADRQVRSGYAKDPATWINQACWLDEIETEEKPNHATKRNSTDGQAHERAQRIVESYLAKQRALGVDYG